ncbi:hypothetical protein CPL67_28330, partial [Klebsiella pneumoniae]
EAREQAKAAGVPLPVWLADRVLTQVASPSEAGNAGRRSARKRASKRKPQASLYRSGWRIAF